MLPAGTALLFIQEILAAILWMVPRLDGLVMLPVSIHCPYTLYCTVSSCTSCVTHYCGKPLLYLGTIWYSIILYLYRNFCQRFFGWGPRHYGLVMLPVSIHCLIHCIVRYHPVPHMSYLTVVNHYCTSALYGIILFCIPTWVHYCSIVRCIIIICTNYCIVRYCSVPIQYNHHCLLDKMIFLSVYCMFWKLHQAGLWASRLLCSVSLQVKCTV